MRARTKTINVLGLKLEPTAANAEALAIGRIKTGAVIHDVAAGGDVFRRSVQMPGYFAADNPASGKVLVKLGFRPHETMLRPSRSRGEEILHQSYSRFGDDLALISRYRPPLVITALGSPRRVLEDVHGYGGAVLKDPAIAKVPHSRGA